MANPTLTAEQIVEILENFLNEHGQWNNFKQWISENGYDLSDFGLSDD